MKMIIGKGVGNVARGYCIHIHTVNSGDDCSSLIHNMGTRACIDFDKTNQTCLVG